MRKQAITAAALLLLPLLGAAAAGAGLRGQGEAEAPPVVSLAAGPAIRLAQDSAEQCKQDCRARFKCNEITATPGLRNPDLIACKKNLQACIGGCK